MNMSKDDYEKENLNKVSKLDYDLVAHSETHFTRIKCGTFSKNEESGKLQLA